MPCRAASCSAVQCRAMPCRAVSCSAVPCLADSAVQCRALQCRSGSVPPEGAVALRRAGASRGRSGLQRAADLLLCFRPSLKSSLLDSDIFACLQSRVVFALGHYRLYDGHEMGFWVGCFSHSALLAVVSASRLYGAEHRVCRAAGSACGGQRARGPSSELLLCWALCSAPC